MFGNMMFVTNALRAEAAFALEQGLRAIDRYRSPTCTEHGFKVSRCRELGLYHAHGKTTHGCVPYFVRPTPESQQ